MNDLEDQFRAQPLRPLPPAWRAEILNAACPESGNPGVSPVALMFRFIPKPVALPLAAAWVIIAILRVSTPASQPSSIATMIAESPPASDSGDQLDDALEVRRMIWIAWQDERESLESMATAREVRSESEWIDDRRAIFP
jgi:hypothetical protein